MGERLAEQVVFFGGHLWNISMIENYLLLIAGAFYLLGAGSLFLSPRLRKWIWASGSILFAIILSGIVLLTQLSLFSKPSVVKINNYSSRIGTLYFMQTGGSAEQVRYELAVNANEGSSLKVEGEEGDYDAVLFLSKGELREVPIQDQAKGQLDVWEKELKPAGRDNLPLLEDWQERQQLYSLAIGAMLFWFLLYLAYLRFRKKRSHRTIPSGSSGRSAGAE